MNNTATLIGYYGGDNSHSLAAWSSTFLELGIELPEDINMRVDKLVEHILSNSKRIRDVKGLLNYLAEHGHTSPFRFSTLHFVTCTDIATHIHFLKHAVALSAENAESARYKELQEDKFYLPEDFKKVEVSDNNIRINESYSANNWYEVLKNISNLTNELYHKCLKDSIEVLGKTRAKESARFFKTYNSQINSNKLMSFDGFLQIYSKRNLKTPAQREVGEVVELMLQEIKNIPGEPFKYSLEAFNL